jgi:hypothetical protein
VRCSFLLFATNSFCLLINSLLALFFLLTYSFLALFFKACFATLRTTSSA